MSSRLPVMSEQTDPADLADPVEWAAHYWKRYDLGEGHEAFVAMTSLMRLARLTAESVETTLKVCDLNNTDYLLLMTLRLSEDGSRLISRLARNLLVHPTTATLATDRLENRGLLRRQPHPTDRRAILVQISQEGIELVDKATDALRSVDFGLEGASSGDLAKLSRMTMAIRRKAGDPAVHRA